LTILVTGLLPHKPAQGRGVGAGRGHRVDWD
jgi:hypothetical protein